MKQTFIKTTFLFFISISFLSCEKDETAAEQKKIIETVSIGEALSFLNTEITKKFSKTPKEQFITFDLDNIAQEAIINSDQLLTVIPAQIENKDIYSRILLLKINNEIESVIFSMVGNEKNEEEHFYGKIYISDLEGHFINGFRVEDNNLVARLVAQEHISSNHNKSIYSKGDACVECPYTDCSYCSLDEVVITATKPKIIIQEIYYTSIVPEESEVEEEEWNPYQNTGGGGEEIAQILLEEPEDPVEDIEVYLECFDVSQGAELTIYVDQPIANDDSPYTTGNGKAGHAFIRISQNGINRSWGLYPEGNASPFNSNDPHAFGNDQGHGFDVSISFIINSAGLNNIIDDANNYPLNYDLNTNNCTDYVLDVAGLCGIVLPDPQSTWTNGGGSNPGAFGEALRTMDLAEGITIDEDGGIAPQNSADCD